jgi:hypothetical protein
MNCLILAGGESLPDILKGRECRQKGWFTIGVNLAGYMIGDWVNVCFFADALMYWNHKDALKQCQARKISLDKTKEGVASIATDPGHTVEVWQWGGCHGVNTRPGFCCFNRSSGGAAINLAYHLGAKRVFLLGYNMNLDENGDMQEWYPEEWKRKSKKGYHNMLLPFDKIAADAKRLGMEILNATPGSAIKQFPFVNIEDYQCLT